jgi:hypothetical protein
MILKLKYPDFPSFISLTLLLNVRGAGSHTRHKHRSMVHDVSGFGHSRATTLRKLSQDLNLEGNSEFPNVLVVIL